MAFQRSARGSQNVATVEQLWRSNVSRHLTCLTGTGDAAVLLFMHQARECFYPLHLVSFTTYAAGHRLCFFLIYKKIKSSSQSSSSLKSFNSCIPTEFPTLGCYGYNESMFVSRVYHRILSTKPAKTAR